MRLLISALSRSSFSFVSLRRFKREKDKEKEERERADNGCALNADHAFALDAG
jgi:hypothetical protein